ncbi:hypothetical protein ACFVEN_44205 [Streptomyces sp. NPDC057681]|uniref:hypothetical protein n=1 Tax=Streptomyces sp. NPDC057681 TaxID=3346209 RepID=UPI0036773AE0
MPEPVGGQLPPYEWDSEKSVAYEAAVEAIGAVVGAYSELISAEEARPESERDEAAIEQWEAAQTACHAERRTLDPDDTDDVRRVRTDYARKLGELAQAAR